MRMILTALACLSGPMAFAQQSAPPAAEAPVPVAMEEPRQGDHWTYEIRDEISGKVTSKRTDTVTEVTPTAIAIRYTNDRDKAGFQVYDRNWNAKTADAMKYTPNSGLGVVQPLKVGSTWPIKVEQTNTEKGFTWRWAGQSKVSGEEKITTKAGTFETFKIETTYTFYPINNPGRKSEAVMQTWYAPAVDHWVLRTNTVRTDNMLRVNSKIELVAYGRKE
ncbi:MULTISPECIES: hypothetical protein [unclassified Bradyrhizobium]|uniref:hypothetical protein n=1 Tax=unclassified Bradyrhizobium TaxID=2631580 RepID=UPI0028EF911C|nr:MULTISPECIES: hypothetical protein [unclassified Bradyrhizobium]